MVHLHRPRPSCACNQRTNLHGIKSSPLMQEVCRVSRGLYNYVMCREHAQAQRALPVAEKSTLSCEMQGCRALAPGQLNPRRFTRKQPSGCAQNLLAAHKHTLSCNHAVLLSSWIVKGRTKVFACLLDTLHGCTSICQTCAGRH